MALTTCRDCGHDLSSRAATCPHCGRRNGPRVLTVVLLVIFLIVLFFFVF
jgi:uncharacterized OB-fold protein